jgi:hypothetical protein
MALLALTGHTCDLCSLVMRDWENASASMAGCRHFCSLCLEAWLATINPKDLPVTASEERLNTPLWAPTIGLRRPDNCHDPCSLGMKSDEHIVLIVNYPQVATMKRILSLRFTRRV